MKYSSVKDLQWGNAERTTILMTVNFDLIGEAPFSASATDTAEHGVQLYKDAVAGKFGPIAAWVDNRDYYGAWKAEAGAGAGKPRTDPDLERRATGVVMTKPPKGAFFMTS